MKSVTRLVCIASAAVLSVSALAGTGCSCAGAEGVAAYSSTVSSPFTASSQASSAVVSYPGVSQSPELSLLTADAIATAMLYQNTGENGYNPASSEDIPRYSSSAVSSKTSSPNTTSSKATSSSKETSSKTDSSSASSSETTSSKTTYTDAELLKLTLEQVKALNNDFYGFLRIPGKDTIKEVVMLTDDMNDYHRYTFYHEYNRYGTIYAQTGTSWTSLQQNTVLYGHNRGKSKYNAQRFGPLVNYRKEGYAQQYPYIYLETFHGSYTFEIFTVMVCHDTVANDDNYMRVNIGDTEATNRYLNHMKDASLYDTGVEVNGSDKIITLVTCVYDFEGSRLVIMGKLVK